MTDVLDRDYPILMMHIDGGMTLRDIASETGMSFNQVDRAIAKERGRFIQDHAGGNTDVNFYKCPGCGWDYIAECQCGHGGGAGHGGDILDVIGYGGTRNDVVAAGTRVIDKCDHERNGVSPVPGCDYCDAVETSNLEGEAA